MRLISYIVSTLLLFATHSTPNNAELDNTYLSPAYMCLDSERQILYTGLSTAKKIAVVNAKTRKLLKYIDIPFNPAGMAISKDGNTLIVADKKPNGHVYFLSTKNKGRMKSVKVGHSPDALVISPDGELLFVANRFSNTVSVIRLIKGKVIKTIPLERDPKAIAISHDGSIVAVANNIPLATSNEQHISAKITLIDRNSLKILCNIKLAGGSQSIEGLAFSKDGKYLYASHILSRNHLPTTQLKNGWMNTNAVSIVDVEKKEYFTTVLLDSYNRGAANPRGMDISDNGKHLYIALSGVHELCVINLPAMHKKLTDTKNNIFNNTYVSSFDEIPGDLRFLYEFKRRIPLKGKSPRHVMVFGNLVFVSSYFSTGIDCVLNPDKPNGHETISLGSQPEMSLERKGELLFCDATSCFQQWQSCLSCHPDGRTDGLNWDLLNDGSGNPKNNKSLLNAHATPPVMITGIRESAELAVRAGIKYIQFAICRESDAQAIDAYLKNMKAVPSPYLDDGRLSKNAKKGKQLFKKAGCLACHSGKHFTNGKSYDVGMGIVPHLNEKFDTPSLIEVWRTAPYLYDGRAKTIEDVFTKFNKNNEHGKTNKLTHTELNNLIEYVLSL